jgi:hypothetical protein
MRSSVGDGLWTCADCQWSKRYAKRSALVSYSPLIHHGADMSDGKHCPACGKDIGLWPVLSAGLPTWVRCPHCKARLTYGSSFLLLFGVAVMVSVVGVVSYYVASRYLVPSSRVSEPLKLYSIVAILFLCLWLPIELAFTLYIRMLGTLKKLD